MKRLLLMSLIFSIHLIGAASGDAAAEGAETTAEVEGWQKNGWEDTGCCAPSKVSVQIEDVGTGYSGEAGNPVMGLFARIPRSAYATFMLTETRCENCLQLGDITIGADVFGDAACKAWFTHPDNILLHASLRHPSSRGQEERLEWDEKTCVVVLAGVPKKCAHSILDGTNSDDPVVSFYKNLYKGVATISGGDFLKARSEACDPDEEARYRIFKGLVEASVCSRVKSAGKK